MRSEGEEPRGRERFIDVEEEKEHKIGLQDGGLWTLARKAREELLCSLWNLQFDNRPPRRVVSRRERDVFMKAASGTLRRYGEPSLARACFITCGWKQS